MRNAIKLVMFGLLCAALAACLTADDGVPGGDDPAHRDQVVDPAAPDVSELTDEAEEAAICCIEGYMTCPATGQGWDYVCANRIWAARQCDANCAPACIRHEYDVC